MRTTALLTVTTLVAALALSACSEQTQKNASETATSASNDVANMAADASSGVDAMGAAASKGVDAMDASASNAAADTKKVGSKIGAAADVMGEHIADGVREAKDELKGKPAPKPATN